MRALIAAVVVSLGCSSTISYEVGSDRDAFENGVPNFYRLSDGVYRMANPTSREAWEWLYKIGVRARIKLNVDEECKWCDDDGAKAAGIVVYRIPIEPRDVRAAGVVEGAVGVFKSIDRATIDRIVAIIESHSIAEIGVAFGCTYGHDRTGLIAGILRTRQGWTKQEAYYHEMIDRGFHRELIGLKKTWDNY